jgi:plasmid stabilization system protein ParE
LSIWTRPNLIWLGTGTIIVPSLPAGAKRAAKAYLTAINTLVENPLMGQAVSDEIRRYSVQKTPFSIFYRLTEQYIEIVRIWDQRADPTKLELHEEASIIA